jgi:hypothetical protein
MAMGSPELQNPSYIVGHIRLGMDQDGSVNVGIVRVRRVIAVPAIASVAAGQIQSFKR